MSSPPLHMCCLPLLLCAVAYVLWPADPPAVSVCTSRSSHLRVSCVHLPLLPPACLLCAPPYPPTCMSVLWPAEPQWFASALCCGLQSPDGLHVTAYIEGPYGSPAADLLGTRHTTFLLIGGGIGVTPVQVCVGVGCVCGGASASCQCICVWGA